jgi:hypothetical protein
MMPVAVLLTALPEVASAQYFGTHGWHLLVA